MSDTKKPIRLADIGSWRKNCAKTSPKKRPRARPLTFCIARASATR